MALDLNTLLEVTSLSSLAALIGVALAFLVVILIAVYVYTSWALMTIAQKTKTKNAWLAWIPIANLLLMLNIAKLPWYCIFAIFIVMLPTGGTILLWAGMAFCWWKIAEKRKKPGYFGLLAAVPIIGYIFMGIIAWSK